MSGLTYEYPAEVVMERARQTRAMIEENERLRKALEEVHRYGLNIAGAAEAYREQDCAHLWNEIAAIAEAALWPSVAPAAEAAAQGEAAV